jgi:hypothetical protein
LFQELTNLKRELQQEAEVLKTELNELRSTVKQHLDATSQIMGSDKSSALSSLPSEDVSGAVNAERSRLSSQTASLTHL